eukprot:TRINITY_DN5893_c0_g1_i4.p1 TRINITY_DN5893_c0_g1~~TRINITY_DN5893_c0_g1_i4.p1  ORF type:complete len:176 (+),score=3.05 TRINITY_DN5893_c0_g1_i4:171-698(+)
MCIRDRIYIYIETRGMWRTAMDQVAMCHDEGPTSNFDLCIGVSVQQGGGWKGRGLIKQEQHPKSFQKHPLTHFYILNTILNYLTHPPSLFSLEIRNRSTCISLRHSVCVLFWNSRVVVDMFDPLVVTQWSGHCTSHLSLIHISEPTRLLSISYAVFCLKKKKNISALIKSYQMSR